METYLDDINWVNKRDSNDGGTTSHTNLVQKGWRSRSGKELLVVVSLHHGRKLVGYLVVGW
jgi:hypothetical protein